MAEIRIEIRDAAGKRLPRRDDQIVTALALLHLRIDEIRAAVVGDAFAGRRLDDAAAEAARFILRCFPDTKVSAKKWRKRAPKQLR